MPEIILTYASAIALAWPLGLYLARVMRGDRSRLDTVFDPIERLVYRALASIPRKAWIGVPMRARFSAAM